MTNKLRWKGHVRPNYWLPMSCYLSESHPSLKFQLYIVRVHRRIHNTTVFLCICLCQSVVIRVLFTMLKYFRYSTSGCLHVLVENYCHLIEDLSLGGISLPVHKYVRRTKDKHLWYISTQARCYIWVANLLRGHVSLEKVILGFTEKVDVTVKEIFTDRPKHH